MSGGGEKRERGMEPSANKLLVWNLFEGLVRNLCEENGMWCAG